MRRFSRKRRRIQGGDDTFLSWLSSWWSKSQAPANADGKNIELTTIYPNKSEYENDTDFEIPKEVQERRKEEEEKFKENKRKTMKKLYDKPSSSPQKKDRGFGCRKFHKDIFGYYR